MNTISTQNKSQKIKDPFGGKTAPNNQQFTTENEKTKNNVPPKNSSINYNTENQQIVQNQIYSNNKTSNNDPPEVLNSIYIRTTSAM